MELNMEQERREFEAWLNEGNHCGCNENMWKAWLAAKRSAGGEKSIAKGSIDFFSL